MEIHIFRNGAKQGPYDEGTVRRLLSEGRLKSTDHAWHEALPDWIPLAQVLPTPFPESRSVPARDDSTIRIQLDAVRLTPAPDVAAAAETVAAPQPDGGAGEPASPRQKVFLSYMGISFPPDLTKESASLLVSEAMENPRNQTRLSRWSEDRLRLHPEIFVTELLAHKENRPERFHGLVESEGAEVFKKVSKAHCQVLVSFLDVKYPNWDAKESEATWNYFFPALAEKFPQLVTKPWRGKLHFPEGPKVATELHHPAAAPARSRRRFQRVPAVPRWARELGLVMAAAVAAGYILSLYRGVPARRAEQGSPATPGVADAAPAVAGGKPAEATPGPPTAAMEASKTEPGTMGEAVPAPPMAEKTAPPDAPAAAPATPSSLFTPPKAGAPKTQIAPSKMVPRRRDVVIVTRPLEFQLPYGRIRINPGTPLKVLRQAGTTLTVSYMNNTVTVPASSTDWQPE
jgi:hypothetical protein